MQLLLRQLELPVKFGKVLLRGRGTVLELLEGICCAVELRVERHRGVFAGLRLRKLCLDLFLQLRPFTRQVLHSLKLRLKRLEL